MANRRVLAAASLATALISCGSSASSSTLSEAFCSDLEKGYSPHQILAGTYEGQEAADRAYGYAAISCSSELQTNEKLRSFLEAWNIDPDA